MNRSLGLGLGRICLAAGVIFSSAFTAQAAFRMGLGQAAAKRAATALGPSPTAAFGDDVAATLPSCGSSQILTNLPTDLAKVSGVVPLGNTSPPGHTFPSDHIYFYMVRTDTSIASSPADVVNVYAPGDATVSDVAATEYLSATTPYTDYSIYFYACRELKFYFFHVQTLSSEFAAKVGSISEGCSTYSTGGVSVSRCSKGLDFSIKAGDLLGTAGGPHAAAFDFGAYDHRITPLAFASPGRHYTDQAYTVCPVDYFVPGLKSQLEARLGRYDGLVLRTEVPVCGTIMQDVVSTAKGDWYRVGQPDSPEDPHLALVHNNYVPSWGTISSGTSISGLQSAYNFVPTTTGQVNRDFNQVTSDGKIYCYDTFIDPIGQLIGATFIVLIQMPTSSTLRIEKQATGSCGGGSWAFSSPVDFQR